MWVILRSGREEKFNKIEFDTNDKGEPIIRCRGGYDNMFEIYKIEEVEKILHSNVWDNHE